MSAFDVIQIVALIVTLWWCVGAALMWSLASGTILTSAKRHGVLVAMEVFVIMAMVAPAALVFLVAKAIVSGDLFD